ncbi:MAG: hypothetical protein ABH886_06110 [Candidatus Desantisbacteria bacterium]
MRRIIWCALILIVLGYNGTTEACLGARPLSMGGAFVAVADDIHSCYWNPAGMGNLQKGEMTWMKTLNNNEMINYQNWTAFGVRMGNAGMGISKVKAINLYDTSGTYTYYTNEDWTTFSFGGWGAGAFENTAMGVNIRKISHALEKRDDAELMKNGKTTREGMGYEAEVTTYDLGFLHKLSDNVTLGLLIQDVSEPKFELNKKQRQHARNFRPGIAFRPDEKTIVDMDVYYFNVKNVYDQEGQSEVRIGAERYLTDNLCVRAGFYGKAFHTLGIGLKSKPSERSTAPKMLYQIDYGLLEGVENAGTHLLSVTLKW